MIALIMTVEAFERRSSGGTDRAAMIGRSSGLILADRRRLAGGACPNFLLPITTVRQGAGERGGASSV